MIPMFPSIERSDTGKILAINVGWVFSTMLCVLSVIGAVSLASIVLR